MKLDFDSEMRDRMVLVLTHRRIPMADIRDVVEGLEGLKPLKPAPVKDGPAQETTPSEPNK